MEIRCLVIKFVIQITSTYSSYCYLVSFILNNITLNTIVIRVKERRPVGLPATGNERHGVQGSTPVSEGCDRYHPLLLP